MVSDVQLFLESLQQTNDPEIEPFPTNTSVIDVNFRRYTLRGSKAKRIRAFKAETVFFGSSSLQ